MTKHLLTTAALLTLAAVSPAIAKHHHTQSTPTPLPAGAPHGAIHGTVRAGTQPLDHIAIRVVNRKHVPAAHSNKSGAFAFENLRPGIYTLVVHTKHHGSARAKLAVDAGRTTELVLPVRQHHHGRYLRPGGVATPGHTPGRVAGLR